MSRIEDEMNISYRQLDHWAQVGYLRPETESGAQRVWPVAEILVGKLMSQLVGLGIAPSKAAIYARSAVVDGESLSIIIVGGRLRLRGNALKREMRKYYRYRSEVKKSRRYRGGKDG